MAPAVPIEQRILDAALDLTARWGIAKTSVGDLARAAGCSRASVYRAFPGGKAEVFQALGRRELLAFFGQVNAAVAEAHDLTDACTVAITTAARALRDHDAVQFLLQHEPDALLPYLGFQRVDALFRATAAACAPYLVRFTGPELASWAGELLGRLVVSHVFMPDPAVDLTDAADVRRLVSTFVVPGLVPAGTATIDLTDPAPTAQPRS